MPKTKRVGVFGGSFDPPHVGHLLAAVYALKIFGLDEIWFVPAYRHAFGKKLHSYSTRATMCKLLLRRMGPQFRISNIEHETRSDGKTFNTLLALSKKHPGFTFSLVIGSDQIKHTARWYKFAELKQRLPVYVVPRGAAHGDVYIPNVSSSKVRSLRKRKKRVHDLLTPAVSNFIRKKKLYLP